MNVIIAKGKPNLTTVCDQNFHTCSKKLLQIEDLNRCHRQHPRGCRTMDTLHSRHSVMRAGNWNYYTTRVTSWLDDVWYSDVYLQSWYVWIYSKSCWSLMTDMFSIHDHLAFQGVGALEQKCGVFQQGKVQHIGYVVPIFGTACRPLKLNVAVEVSWLSTCLHVWDFSANPILENTLTLKPNTWPPSFMAATPSWNLSGSVWTSRQD